jgi:hypothetical protein
MQRTSNPTPPERSDVKKTKMTGSQLPVKSPSNIQLVDVNVNREIQQSSVMPHLSLSEEDIDKIATAVKQKITVDIESIITAKTEPLIFRISKLERENNELMANLDSLEQYGRRSLIRVAGISEGGSDEDTNTIVQKIISDIDPDLSPTDIERSHRVGKLGDSRGHNHARPRQIIVRLTNPIVKRRILKCRKNLKSYSKYKHVYINEDLTRTRNKIHSHARQLLKRKTIAQLWTTNGKILMKDKDNRIYETNTMDALAEVVQLLDPTYELIQK